MVHTPTFNNNIADFALGYRTISATYPGATPGTYTVRTGDTLRGLAQSAYGDARKWTQIASANGLRGDADLRVGQTITIPTVVSSGNGEHDFAPYEAGKMVGDTRPAMRVRDGVSAVQNLWRASEGRGPLAFEQAYSTSMMDGGGSFDMGDFAGVDAAIEANMGEWGGDYSGNFDGDYGVDGPQDETNTYDPTGQERFSKIEGFTVVSYNADVIPQSGPPPTERDVLDVMNDPTGDGYTNPVAAGTFTDDHVARTDDMTPGWMNAYKQQQAAASVPQEVYRATPVHDEVGNQVMRADGSPAYEPVLAFAPITPGVYDYEVSFRTESQSYQESWRDFPSKVTLIDSNGNLQLSRTTVRDLGVNPENVSFLSQMQTGMDERLTWAGETARDHWVDQGSQSGAWGYAAAAAAYVGTAYIPDSTVEGIVGAAGGLIVGKAVGWGTSAAVRAFPVLGTDLGGFGGRARTGLDTLLPEGHFNHGSGANASSANAADALSRKLAALQDAQLNAARIVEVGDGRTLYIGREIPARTPGPTRGASFVTEFDSQTGRVRQYYEAYDSSGNPVRVHPKMIDGEVVISPHYPPTSTELGK